MWFFSWLFHISSNMNILKGFFLLVEILKFLIKYVIIFYPQNQRIKNVENFVAYFIWNILLKYEWILKRVGGQELLSFRLLFDLCLERWKYNEFFSLICLSGEYCVSEFHISTKPYSCPATLILQINSTNFPKYNGEWKNISKSKSNCLFNLNLIHIWLYIPHCNRSVQHQT